MEHSNEIEIRFQLDNTVDFFIKHFKRLKIFSLYKETDSIFELIEKVKSFNGTKIPKGNDYFEIPITTNVKDDHYTIIWDIERLKKAIIFDERTIIQANLKSIHWDDSNLLNLKLVKLMNEFPNFKMPIFLVEYTMNDTFFVIDGNHRCKIFSEYKRKNINAIILTFEEMFEFLYSEYHKNLFSLHFNFFSMAGNSNNPNFKKMPFFIDNKLIYIRQKAALTKWAHYFFK